ncbi:Heat shock 70 kDa protein [Quillaja saponaria]|uniref:Heat shock 70 kDa protein n=1 Tax=Quillaja saponaria TaxID=32244 RepID=A0AAD7LUM5_QUISA|nr:Heat shock 70 kDa protein [Quillaja saponaria]
MLTQFRMASIQFKLGVFLSVLLLLLSPSQSAVFSVDLGSEWLKVAVVNLKPGQSPISIAINEMSKRKSPALVSFHSGNRLLGEEAAGLVARYPQKVYSQIRDLIGKPYSFTNKFLDSLYLPFEIKEDSRGAVSFKVDDNETTYSAEELLAMILSYAMNLAEFHSKVPIKDAVITVPPYFGQAERKGLLQAAQLAGINVLSLINEHSGAALHTYAALVYFSAYNAKEYGKTVSINQFQVKDVIWNPELGGQNMEIRLVEYFADEFNKQAGNGIDVRKSPKAMAKLKKQVKRTKEILSANTAAPISVESIYDDLDFRSTITREKFEELCEDLWDKSLSPVKELLERSGVTVDEIHAVELIGGATRVPKLQAKLQEFLGRKELDRHLDADEAIVLGAALHAANLSDGIKLNRKLGMVDGSLYGFMVELNGPGLVQDESSRQLLVQRMKKLPSKMFRSVIHDKDFEVSLAYEHESLLPPGVTFPVISQYDISGLTDTSEKYSSRNISSPIKANLHFSLSRSGILSLDRADAVIEITEWIEVPRKNLTVENSTFAAPNISIEAGAGNSSEDGNERLNSDGGINNTSNSITGEGNSGELGVERKLKKRTYRVPLKIVEKTVGSGISLSKEFIAEAKLKLEALDKKDAERRRTAELKNNLEGYIYTTKEKLETVEEFEKISTSQATHFQLLKSLIRCKTGSIGDPIFFRFKELTARPVATEHARKYLDELQQIIQGWETNKPWLPKERIDEVLTDAEKFKNWLNDKEAEQKKTSAFSTPAFTSEEVYGKVFDLQDKVTSVNRIPKPKPKIQKASKNESSAENVNNSNTASGESSSKNEAPDTNSQSSRDENADPESGVHDEL